MRVRTVGPALLALAAAVWAAENADYTSATRKFERIEAEQLPANSRVVLSARELNAWVEQKVPAGVRNPKLLLGASGEVTGSAMVDFVKVRRAQGDAPGWLMTKLLEGERPVSVTARIRSSDGQATVDVQRVQIGGLLIDGKTLDFLIQYILLPLYPNAVVGRSFDLAHRIEKLDVQPGAVTIVIGK